MPPPLGAADATFDAPRRRACGAEVRTPDLANAAEARHCTPMALKTAFASAGGRSLTKKSSKGGASKRYEMQVRKSCGGSN